MKGSKDKCWNCDGRNMKAVKTWFECQDCGATWVPPQELGYDPLDVHRDKQQGTSGSPSKPVATAAAKAREGKGA